MIQLTEKEYLDLVADRNKLWALKACGVDNWEGYDNAMRVLEDEDMSEESEVGEPVEDHFECTTCGTLDSHKMSCPLRYPQEDDIDDFPLGTCNPDAPEECESCQ